MTLRQKLLLGFGGLLLIIAILGYHSISRVTELGRSIDVILRENYRSVLACQEMKDALAQMDRGAAFSLLGDENRGKEQISGNLPRFGKALDTEIHNITITGEGEKADRLRVLFGRYGAAIGSVGDSGLTPEARKKIYFSELMPLSGEINGTADAIQQMNQESMVSMDRDARTRAASAKRQTVVLLAVVLMVTALFMYGTGRWILRPIRTMIASTNEIRQGNLDLVLQAGAADEIGQLSDSFNEMAAALREFRRSGQAKMVRIQRSVQQAFDSLPDAIAVLDPDGRVEVATAAARDGFGLRPEVYLQDLPHAWAVPVVEKALRTGRPAQSPGPPVQQFIGNEERFWLPRAIPILDADKLPAGVMLVLEDVTRQREQDELKRSVISTVSHQLKTPLTSIRMAVHLLLDEKIGALAEKQVEVLLAARDDADRLNAILDDLLDISRIESGRAAMAFRPVPPALLATSVAEPFRAMARDSGLTFEVAVAGELPNVWVDPARITNVFDNLISNALKHTPAGGRVTLTAASDEGHVRFRVTDTGVGIPAQYLPHLFEPFFRVPGQGAETGIGLGLSIVKEIVEAHGGTVEAESREGEGSTFVITLNRADHVPREDHAS
ncbi:MAG TPA: ATP-binding protein [Candidatus Deferrimicrobiaceae bacterium]